MTGRNFTPLPANYNNSTLPDTQVCVYVPALRTGLLRAWQCTRVMGPCMHENVHVHVLHANPCHARATCSGHAHNFSKMPGHDTSSTVL